MKQERHSWGPCPVPLSKESEFKIHLEPSLYFKKRQSLINGNCIPTIREAEELIGKLARLVYAECDIGLQPLIERTKEGMPYGDMWDSPSDLIKEKLVLKFPPTKRHMKKLNHEGIIAVGSRIERQFLRILYKERQQALDDQAQWILDNYEKSIEDQVNDAKVKERLICAEQAEVFLKTFQENMALELKKMKKKIRKNYGEMTANQNAVIVQTWKEKVKEAVLQTTENITLHFLEELTRQEEMMAMSLKSDLTKCEIERRFVIEKGQEEFNSKLKMIKHHLECQNVTNMMYILCMERHKCVEEAEALKKYYKEGIHESVKVVTHNKERLAKMKNDISKLLQELKVREACILEVLKQYQNFIKIALKKAPVHAEFLLSIEKLLLFELTETLSKMKPCSKSTLPSSVSTTETEASTSTSDVSKVSGKKSVIKSKKQEPHFVFHHKLYVKEDFNKFKELVSKTLEHPKDNLGGEGAELYIQTLRESVPGWKTTDSKLLALSNLMFPHKIKKTLPHRSSFIEFKLSPESQPCYDLMKKVPLNDAYRLRKLNNTYKSLKYRSKKPIDELLSPIDYSKLGFSEKNPNLLASTDSAELFAAQLSSQRILAKNLMKGDEYTAKEEYEEREINSKSYRGSLDYDDQSSQKKRVSDTNEDPKQKAISNNQTGWDLSLQIKDSLILRQTSLLKQQDKSFSLSPKDSIDVKIEAELSALLRKRSSKLIATRDSVAYLKESKLALLTAGVCSICHQRNGVKQYDKDYCCERCLKEISEDQESLHQGKNEKRRDSADHEQLKHLLLSHVEVIETDQRSPRSVDFSCGHTVIESSSSLVTGKRFKPAKKLKVKEGDVKVDPCQNLFIQTAEIEGDKTNKEYLQNKNEFTKDRVRSFVKLMDTHPNLIRLFTSCQQ